MEGNNFESALKMTRAPNNIRGHLLDNGEFKKLTFWFLKFK